MTKRGKILIFNGKIVSISKVCNVDYSAITLLTTFISQPSIKSYDVVWTRFMNKSLYSTCIHIETVTIDNLF